MSPHDIRQTAVAELGDDQDSQAVAVRDLETGAVESVTPRGRDAAEAQASIVEQVGEKPDAVVVLGERYWDIEVSDVATLVALEWRERVSSRGSVVSEGPLYAVLEYESHVVDENRWRGRQQARLRLRDLREQTGRGAKALRKAANEEDRSLSDVRYLLGQGLRNPVG